LWTSRRLPAPALPSCRQRSGHHPRTLGRAILHKELSRARPVACLFCLCSAPGAVRVTPLGVLCLFLADKCMRRFLLCLRCACSAAGSLSESESSVTFIQDGIVYDDSYIDRLLEDRRAAAFKPRRTAKSEGLIDESCLSGACCRIVCTLRRWCHSWPWPRQRRGFDAMPRAGDVAVVLELVQARSLRAAALCMVKLLTACCTHPSYAVTVPAVPALPRSLGPNLQNPEYMAKVRVMCSMDPRSLGLACQCPCTCGASDVPF
jgi:hypothetical protein